MSEEPTALGPHGVADPHAIHLPPPSFWPPVLAVGIACALAGLVISPVVWIGGLAIMAVALGGWFRELGRDVLEAPIEPES